VSTILQRLGHAAQSTSGPSFSDENHLPACRTAYPDRFAYASLIERLGRPEELKPALIVWYAEALKSTFDEGQNGLWATTFSTAQPWGACNHQPDECPLAQLC